MRAQDVAVEVRDRQLSRVGTITQKFLKLTATLEHNGVGEWELTLPGKHPMVPYLSAEGSGVIVYLRGAVVWSGPTVLPARKADRQNPDGTYTFTGVTDTIVLADARAFPSPAASADPSMQTQANDKRSGSAESLMRQYVAYNIANGALAANPVQWALPGRLAGFRNYLTLEAVNQNRGGIVTKSPRFQNLLELLIEIATLSNLGFRVIQRGAYLVFEVLTVNDVSGTVRFDIANGTLSSEEVKVTPPSVTRAIVAGQGEGVARVIITRTTAASTASESTWGRVIEDFIDQRSSDELVELQQAGDEALADDGFTATNVKVVPTDSVTMLYLDDWNVGDRVAVIVNGKETKTTVTAAAFIVNDDACVVGAAIGDVKGFNAADALTKRVDDVDRRTEALERTVEISTTPPPWIAGLTVTPGNGTGRKYVYLGTIDGNSQNDGGHLEFIISGVGGISSMRRSSVLVHVGQRGADQVFMESWLWGSPARSTSELQLFTRRISTYKFQIYALFASWSHQVSVTTLGKNPTTTMALGEPTVTAPSGLLEWPVGDGVTPPQQAQAMAASTFDQPAVLAGASVTVAVTFPPGRFTATPVVTAQGGSVSTLTSVSSVTTSGFNVTFRNPTTTNGGATTAAYHAVQMTATSGAG